MERLFDLYKKEGYNQGYKDGYSQAKKEFEENFLKTLDNSKDLLYTMLSDYFCISDSYTYELTRIKTAEITVEDFNEWEDKDIDDLVVYLEEKLKSIFIEEDINNGT